MGSEDKHSFLSKWRMDYYNRSGLKIDSMSASYKIFQKFIDLLFEDISEVMALILFYEGGMTADFDALNERMQQVAQCILVCKSHIIELTTSVQKEDFNDCKHEYENNFGKDSRPRYQKSINPMCNKCGILFRDNSKQMTSENMNDFMKEDLQYIYDYIFTGYSLISFDKHKILEDKKILEEKIQYMINSYCKHSFAPECGDEVEGWPVNYFTKEKLNDIQFALESIYMSNSELRKKVCQLIEAINVSCGS